MHLLSLFTYLSLITVVWSIVARSKVESILLVRVERSSTRESVCDVDEGFSSQFTNSSLSPVVSDKQLASLRSTCIIHMHHCEILPKRLWYAHWERETENRGKKNKKRISAIGISHRSYNSRYLINIRRRRWRLGKEMMLLYSFICSLARLWSTNTCIHLLSFAMLLHHLQVIIQLDE